MRALPCSAFIFSLLLAGCATPAGSGGAPRAGADRDAHGCIASAGYQWCAREHACVRPWELAHDRELSVEAAAIAGYCAGP